MQFLFINVQFERLRLLFNAIGKLAKGFGRHDSSGDTKWMYLQTGYKREVEVDFGLLVASNGHCDHIYTLRVSAREVPLTKKRGGR